MSTQASRPHWQEALGMLILRLGLAWFLSVWAVNKILAPVQYQKLWGYFHGIDIGSTLPYVMGGLQIIISLAIAIGLWRAISYALGFLMHSVTIVVIFPSLIAPFVIDNGFPTNRNQAIAVAAWAGFAALWLLRKRDYWSLDVWWGRNRRKNNVST
jgi:putative oxidoreductase